LNLKELLSSFNVEHDLPLANTNSRSHGLEESVDGEILST
jgi:hypothetical protein